jgi:hypothetical protein
MSTMTMPAVVTTTSQSDNPAAAAAPNPDLTRLQSLSSLSLRYLHSAHHHANEGEEESGIAVDDEEDYGAGGVAG